MQNAERSSARTVVGDGVAADMTEERYQRSAGTARPQAARPRTARPGRARLVVATLLLLIALAGAHGQRTADAGSDPLSLAAPPDEVKDPFIAMVIGLLAHDAFVELDGDTLRRLFPELAEIADIPF